MLLSTDGDRILSIHVCWRNYKLYLRKNFGDVNVSDFLEHCSESYDLLSSEPRIQKSLQRDMWKMLQGLEQ